MVKFKMATLWTILIFTIQKLNIFVWFSNVIAFKLKNRPFDKLNTFYHLKSGIQIPTVMIRYENVLTFKKPTSHSLKTNLCYSIVTVERISKCESLIMNMTQSRLVSQPHPEGKPTQNAQLALRSFGANGKLESTFKNHACTRQLSNTFGEVL